MLDETSPNPDQSLLLRALELPVEERAAFLQEAANGDEPLRRQVALKAIRLGMDTQQVVARFETERQTLPTA